MTDNNHEKIDLSNPVLLKGLSDDFVASHAAEGLLRIAQWEGSIPEGSANLPNNVEVASAILKLLMTPDFAQIGDTAVIRRMNNLQNGQEEVIYEAQRRIGFAGEINQNDLEGRFTKVAWRSTLRDMTEATPHKTDGLQGCRTIKVRPNPPILRPPKMKPARKKK
jgi:hypothetical protein